MTLTLGAKRILKKYHSDKPVDTDTISKSMTDALRYRYINDGDTVYEYGLLPISWRQKEVDEFLVDEIVTRPYSAYDCTGKLFTVSIRAKITPSGWAYVHKLWRDV